MRDLLRAARRIRIVAATLLWFSAMPVVTAQRAGAQAPCAHPNVMANIVHAVDPVMPPMAQQQGITGTVQVLVSLDEQSRVVGTSIQSSPSAILNASALVAARTSTYQTEIRDCKPIAGQYIYALDFNLPTPGPRIVQAPRDPAIVVNAAATATRPADVAYVNANLIATDDVEARATAKNAAMFAALSEKLRALGIGAENIRSSYNSSYNPRPAATPVPVSGPVPPVFNVPRYGYIGNRQIVVAVDRPDDAGKVTEALIASGASFVAPVQYDLRDREPAYNEALAAAMKNAQTRAVAAAAASSLRLGAVQHVEVNERGAGFTGAFWSTSSFPPPGPRAQPAAANPAAPRVVVTASVTVTYLIQR